MEPSMWRSLLPEPESERIELHNTSLLEVGKFREAVFTI
jgi:hypothetical protein